MELGNVPMVILTIVIVGILIGVGVVVLDEFGIAVKTSTAVVNESITMAAGAGATANDDLTALSYFGNSTAGNSTDNTAVTIDVNVNWTTAGAITVDIDQFPVNGTYAVSYTYDRDTAATTATFSARNATDDFVTWLPVIIIIIAAAIILGLVMKSFRQ